MSTRKPISACRSSSRLPTPFAAARDLLSTIKPMCIEPYMRPSLWTALCLTDDLEKVHDVLSTARRRLQECSGKTELRKHFGTDAEFCQQVVALELGAFHSNEPGLLSRCLGKADGPELREQGTYLAIFAHLRRNFPELTRESGTNGGATP